MDRLATSAAKLILAASFIIVSACFGNGPLNDLPEAANANVLPGLYERLVFEVRRTSSAEQFLTRVSDDIDNEALLALKKEINSDPRAKRSIPAKCGAIDILSCYQQKPSEETFLKHVDESHLTMACLQYKGQAGDYLVANVYYVFKKKWGFVGVSKKYIERKGERLVDTYDCWNP